MVIVIVNKINLNNVALYNFSISNKSYDFLNYINMKECSICKYIYFSIFVYKNKENILVYVCEICKLKINTNYKIIKFINI